MNDTPIMEGDYYHVDQDKQRSLSKMKGERIMRFANFKTEQERIEQARAQQALMDSSPIQDHTLHLRPRQREKEIGPDFRFKAKNRFERIADVMNSNGYAFNLEGSPKNKSGRNSVPPKLPSIHSKTHFKAVKTIHLKQKCSLFDERDDRKANQAFALQTMSNFQKTQNLIKGGKGRNSMTDLHKADYSQMAQSALKNCKVLREKHYETQILKRGQGMLMSTRGKSNKEAQERIERDFN